MSDSSYRISIVTPTYNRAHLLPRVWKSLVCQTERNFQWIVVDDGSTDETAEVVKGFGDSRITFVRQENLGCNMARNRGEREIRAPFVIFLDSDDELLDSTTLELILAEVGRAPEDVGCVGFTVVDPEGREGLFHMAADRLVLGYEDIVCEEKARGEFFLVYKRKALEIRPWPRFNGLEALRHWAIARHYPVLLIRRPARIYHSREGDNLTSAAGAIQRAAQMSEALMELIEDHRAAWSINCPSQHGRYLFYAAMYQALAGQSFRAWSSTFSSLRNRGPRKKACLLMASLLVPAVVRRKIFLMRKR